MKIDNKIIVQFLRESNMIEGYDYPESAYLQVLMNPESLSSKLVITRSIFAFQYILQNYRRAIDITDILTLHFKLMNGLMGDEQAGSFRTGQVFVGDSVPPKAEVVHYHLINFIKNFQKGFLYKSLQLHYEFERIHPFFDGNGRIGRLLWLWHRLYSGGHVYPILQEFDGDTFFDRRFNYYNAISKYTKQIS